MSTKWAAYSAWGLSHLLVVLLDIWGYLHKWIQDGQNQRLQNMVYHLLWPTSCSLARTWSTPWFRFLQSLTNQGSAPCNSWIPMQVANLPSGEWRAFPCSRPKSNLEGLCRSRKHTPNDDPTNILTHKLLQTTQEEWNKHIEPNLPAFPKKIKSPRFFYNRPSSQILQVVFFETFFHHRHLGQRRAPLFGAL